MKRILAFVTVVTFLFSILCINSTALPSERKMSGVWLCTVGNLDYPSAKGLDKKTLEAELDSAIEKCKSKGINTIFFQVRPNSDALYNSDIFPWSAVLSGTQGVAPDSGFDPLSCAVSKAHAAGIELHAWINPYRIGDKAALCDENPASVHPEWTVTCSDGNMYYNPALSEVRKLICDGVQEIIDKYDVDGIHFDDYFYPYDVEDFPDAKDYQKYGAAFDNIGDFRRDNVNKLVSSVNELVHKKDKNLSFGISPFGIWDNKKDNPLGSDTSGMSSYRNIYADSKYWIENSMVDYICPQIYWSFENEIAPFRTLVEWWNDLCYKNKVSLYVGIGLYKSGTDEIGFDDKNQITRQLSLCENMQNISGTVLFRYGDLDKLNPGYTSASLEINSPQNGYSTTSENVSVSGVCPGGEKLFCGNKEIPITENGYFSVYLPLDMGTNTFTFTAGFQQKTITVKRNSKTFAKVQMQGPFEKDSVSVSGQASFFTGENVTLSLRAYKRCEVFAKIGDEEIKLIPSGDGDIITFSADVMMPELFLDTDIHVSYYAVENGVRTDCSAFADIKVLTRPIEMYTLENTYLFDSHIGGSMMDNYQYPAGTRVKITAAVGDMYRLDIGKWVKKESLVTEKPVTDLEIDTDKYYKISASMNCGFTYSYDLDESGVLQVDIISDTETEPKIKSDADVLVNTVRMGRKTKLILRKTNKKITGFFVRESGIGNLDIYLLKSSPGLSGKTIVIDAGHGGSDSGALGPCGKNGDSESKLNLDMSLLLKERLEKNGATVILTRSSDDTIDLSKRSEIIGSYNPDLCISVHHNSLPQESDFNTATGFLTLYSRETALSVATAISQKAHVSTGLETLGARAQSLSVCREYRFPCVLIECGFVCNPTEYQLVITNDFKNRVCENITLALSEYFV